MGNEMLREAARDFLVAWERAESNRGCYATAPGHDTRCPAWGGLLNDAFCACGRHDMEKMAERLREVLNA